MKLKYEKHMIWHSPTDKAPASLYIATNDSKKLFLVIASRSGHGDGTSSNKGRPELIKRIKKELSDLRVQGLELFKVHVRKRIIMEQYHSSLDVLNKNVSLALWFPNMTMREVGILLGELTPEQLQEQEKKALERREYSLDDLANELKEARKMYTTYYTARDPKAADAARKRDDYKCQFPGCKNTFLSENGIPYVEVHHLKPIKNNGSDELDNLVCLCAHHHAMIHYADEKTRDRMRKELCEKVRQKRTEFSR